MGLDDIDGKPKERRDHRRMNVDVPLTFTVDGDPTPHEGVSLNLSASGLRFRTSQSVPADAHLYVKIPSLHEKLPPFEAEVRVIRADADGAGSYVVACEMMTVR